VPPEIAERHAARHATWIHAAPGQALLDFADATDDVFFVASGAVRIVVRTPGGRELLLDDIGSGGFFGEMSAIDGAPRSAAVTALTGAAICRLSGRGFRALLDESPALSRAVMRLLVRRVRDGNARMLQLATLDSRQRLHAELLRAAGPPAADGSRAISPPPVQQALANRIGTSREAVSREVARLLREGLLARRRGALVLTDPARLAQGLED
jgi:CRP-like cAMP-binding protein